MALPQLAEACWAGTNLPTAFIKTKGMSMKTSDLEIVKETIKFADGEAKNLRRKNIDASEFYQHWVQFLTHQANAFNEFQALEARNIMNGRAKAWWGRKKKVRKDDELLSYVLHARNAKNHHGIRRVARTIPKAMNGIVFTATNKGFVAATAGMPETTILTWVEDCKIIYKVPSTHLGKNLTGAQWPSMDMQIAYSLGIAEPPNVIADLADLVVKYLESLIVEAQDYID